MKNIIFTIFLFAIQSINMMAIAKDGAVNVDSQLASELNTLKQEKLSIESKFKTMEAACYKKFAVSNCLQEVKSEKSLALGEIKRRELEVNDQKRQLKADMATNKQKKLLEKEIISDTTSKTEKSNHSVKNTVKPVSKEQKKLIDQRALEAQQRVLDATQKQASSRQKAQLRDKKLSQKDEQIAKFNRKIFLAEQRKNAMNKKMEAITKPKSATLPVSDLNSR
jgi:colicin import membrane protein